MEVEPTHRFDFAGGADMMVATLHAEPDPALYPILARHLGRIDPPPKAERRPGEGTALMTLLAGDRSGAAYTTSREAATSRRVAA